MQRVKSGNKKLQKYAYTLNYDNLKTKLNKSQNTKLKVEVPFKRDSIHACFYFLVHGDCDEPFDLYHAYVCPGKNPSARKN